MPVVISMCEYVGTRITLLSGKSVNITAWGINSINMPVHQLLQLTKFNFYIPILSFAAVPKFDFVRFLVKVLIESVNIQG